MNINMYLHIDNVIKIYDLMDISYDILITKIIHDDLIFKNMLSFPEQFSKSSQVTKLLLDE